MSRVKRIPGLPINLDGLLRIEVTRVGNESTLGKVIALMQRAERSKPPITRLLETLCWPVSGAGAAASGTHLVRDQ